MATLPLWLRAYQWTQFLVLAYLCSKGLRALQFYLLYSCDLSKYKPKSNKPVWGLVTGASDGIGQAFAQELCRSGFNVVIHGRNEKKLQGVKAELEREFPGREIRVLVLDAANMSWAGGEADANILAAVEDIDLSVLINNLGGSGGVKPEFLPVVERSAEELDICVDINVRFMTQITRVLLPVLTKDKSRKAAIANISSGAELISTPLLVAYSGSKAYVSRWSLSLDAELRLVVGVDLDIHSVLVGAVSTNNTQFAQSLWTPDTNTMARATLSKLGGGHVVCTPYWPHGLQMRFVEMFPAWVTSRMLMKSFEAQIKEQKKR
jgi:17beta-estradiol 17-dehydrogenase / very-long-chain 3-oxoacyl-CoA reductase